MKNIICIIVTFLTTPTLYSQNFDYLKKCDTIYIEYRGNEYEKKYSAQISVDPTVFEERFYDFAVNIKDRWRLTFVLIKYKNWEKKEAKITSEVRKVNDIFLKEQKNIIIGIDFLKKYNREVIICEILKRNKVFYIIDYTEKEKCEVKIYEVNCLNDCPIGE